MKKLTLFSILSLVIGMTSSCNTETLEVKQDAIDPNFAVFESNNSQTARTTLDEPCSTRPLIAGQTIEIGSVKVDSDGSNLFIIYELSAEAIEQGWSIDETHLSIGNCDEQWVPTTGSGNPKVGKFQHSATHPDGTLNVTYTLDQSVLDNVYCFATHAAVSGPSNETAWSGDFEFDGNNWAKYEQASLSDCDLEVVSNK